jgi:hypothetical protein
MRFYDVPVNQSGLTEANRGLTSYRIPEVPWHMRAGSNDSPEAHTQASSVIHSWLPSCVVALGPREAFEKTLLPCFATPMWKPFSCIL